MTTSSRGRRREVTGRTAFLDGFNFTLLNTSHKLVNIRSRPTDLVRSAAKIKFQSSRGSSDRYSLRRFSNQYSVQFDPARLCNIRNKIVLSSKCGRILPSSGPSESLRSVLHLVGKER